MNISPRSCRRDDDAGYVVHVAGKGCVKTFKALLVAGWDQGLSMARDRRLGSIFVRENGEVISTL